MNILGNYWDWVWPIYSDSFRFFYDYYSWSSANLGISSGYNSAMFFNFFLSELIFDPAVTSILIFSILLVILLLVSRKQFEAMNWPLTFLLIFNSSILYKLMAGHLNYFLSYIIFFILIGLFFIRYKKRLLEYFLLGLLLAFVGLQIQFFVFTAIFLLIYFFNNKDKFSLKYLAISLAIVILINLPWLSNFILGINSVTSTSEGATEMLFSGSAFASLPRIFFMVFSNATNIQYVYDKWTFAYFGMFTCLVYFSVGYYYLVKRGWWGIIKLKLINNAKNDKGLVLSTSLEMTSGSDEKKEESKNRKKIDVIVLNLIVFTVLGTGFFHKIPIPFIKTFYPMFRESGHFTPIIVLFEVLALAFTLPYIIDATKSYSQKINKGHILSTFNFLLITYFVGFIGINTYYMYKYLPRVDYQMAREKFMPFYEFNKIDDSTHRVLTYPFWNQYGFVDVPNVEKNGKLLNNSGWDSFMGFSGKEIISNYQAGGQSIGDTLQYRLLTTNDISELEKKNVKYIYDFQKIYVSNWERYTNPATYFNDLSLIKNDPQFMDKIISANPGKITKVEDNIYKLNQAKPRIYLEDQSLVASSEGGDKAQLYFKKINPTKYKIYIKGLKDKVELNFLESYHKDWKIYLENIYNDQDTRNNNQNPSWCYNAEEQNNGATECVAERKFTEWDEFKYLLAKPIAEDTHEKYEDYGNKWVINSEKLKTESNEQITVNSDGSIDLEMTLYFWPQTPFYLSLIISITTILGTASFLLYNWLRNRKKNESV